MLYLNFLNFEMILDLQESCKNSNEKFEIKKKGCGKSRQCIKKQRHHLPIKGPNSQRHGFLSSHVQM